ncbi:rhamnulokinase family protein [Marinococcus sp. PL1-022]|uniref:rhamnulokinase n=1 Tax=Marinococcus sp. PL1-022 TaxID=3095363 RepID=UPI0029C28E70|nr:rhamnulokinase family protein [Marinococcus sp. PL1-022]MDX6151624.1 rhamnulokinase family protein [Marinococcus sp. PL1-022]
MSVLAFDLGAGSGRAVLGWIEAGRLETMDVHRFKNEPVRVNGRFHWDIYRIFHELKEGIRAAYEERQDIESIAIDSWAVDFGCVGQDGELLRHPYHYRDAHTDGVMEQVTERIGKKFIFERTGIQFLPFNTIYQLEAMVKADSPALKETRTLLMIPDLLRYFLTGEMKSEFTNATTTQLFNPRTMDWDEDLLKAIGVPREWMAEVVMPGTRVGELREDLQQELQVPAIPVYTSAEHDTGAAVAGVPAASSSFAYLSCGTWSLMGTEIEEPNTTPEAFEWNFTNEGGVERTFRLLKNIMGLWIFEECRRAWRGDDASHEALLAQMEEAPAFQSYIDPDDLQFLHPADMPAQIQEYCRESGQKVPETKGEIVRCIMESLAMKYRHVLERTEQLSGQSFSGLYMVGGGIKNTYLSQFTANALGRNVWAGPKEASALGNITVQLTAAGKIKDRHEARSYIRKAVEVNAFSPKEHTAWNTEYELFCERTGLGNGLSKAKRA